MFWICEHNFCGTTYRSTGCVQRCRWLPPPGSAGDASDSDTSDARRPASRSPPAARRWAACGTYRLYTFICTTLKTSCGGVAEMAEKLIRRTTTPETGGDDRSSADARMEKAQKMRRPRDGARWKTETALNRYLIYTI